MILHNVHDEPLNATLGVKFYSIPNLIQLLVTLIAYKNKQNFSKRYQVNVRIFTNKIVYKE